MVVKKSANHIHPPATHEHTIYRTLYYYYFYPYRSTATIRLFCASFSFFLINFFFALSNNTFPLLHQAPSLCYSNRPNKMIMSFPYYTRNPVVSFYGQSVLLLTPLLNSPQCIRYFSWFSYSPNQIPYKSVHFDPKLVMYFPSYPQTDFGY